jgi:hypothetical protein
LYKRLSAREFNERTCEGRYPPNYFRYFLELPFLESVRRIAPPASCRAASEANEYAWKSSKGGFTLDALIDLVDEELSGRFISEGLQAVCQR